MTQASIKSRHVLHILAGRLLGGADRYAISLAEGLKERCGYNSSFALLMEGSGAEAARQAGFPVYVLDKRHRCDLRCVGRLSEVVRQTGATILHSHTFATNFYSRLALRSSPTLASIPVVYTMHGFDFLISRNGENRVPWRVRLLLLQDRLGLSRVQKIIAISQHVCEVSARYGYPSDKLRVIYNAVPLSTDIESLRERGRLLRTSSGLADVPLIGTTGRMVPIKNQRALLETVRLLRDGGLCVNAVLIGDGPLRSELEMTAKSLNIVDQVRFMGIRSDAVEWAAAMDVFCLPSLCEGMGLVLLEAMAVGTPVVASAAGGVLEFVQQGETGLLVPPGDSHALAESVRHLLTHPEESLQMSQRAMEMVKERFSFDRWLAEVAQVYEECWQT